MSKTTTNTSGKTEAKGKSGPASPIEEGDVIVKKTYRMAEIMKKYPVQDKQKVV